MNIKQTTRRISPELIIQAEKPRRLVKSQRFNALFLSEPFVDSFLFFSLLCLHYVALQDF